MNCLYMYMVIKLNFQNVIVIKCKIFNLYYYILKWKCDIYWLEVVRELVYYGDFVVELELEFILLDYVFRVMFIKLVSGL